MSSKTHSLCFLTNAHQLVHNYGSVISCSLNVQSLSHIVLSMLFLKKLDVELYSPRKNDVYTSAQFIALSYMYLVLTSYNCSSQSSYQYKYYHCTCTWCTSMYQQSILMLTRREKALVECLYLHTYLDQLAQQALEK